MAVDENLHKATDCLIQSPRPRTYYHATIPNQHWQLRSLIGSPKRNIVYYPNGSDIIRLNTRSRERELITSLSFKPKCLTAARGWVCCGGDEGSYTAIYVGDKKTGWELSTSDADAQFPQELDPAGRSASNNPSSPTIRDSRLHYDLFPSVKSLGTEINNCITLWFPPAKPSGPTYQAPIAVVARNDCFVSILNLVDSEEIEHILYPDYVNKAVLSPDGHVLIAICDDPFLYVHTRTVSQTEFGGKGFSHGRGYKWKRVNKIQIQGQSNEDSSTLRGSFAACFSQSGKYLAVATQYGIISVFDATLLTQQIINPLLATLTTSRPNTYGGAVRAMEFSPGSFDLLAWTEAGGRVGVADVRDQFTSKQLLILDPHVDGVERVHISIRPDDSILDPSLRIPRTNSPLGSTTPEYIGLDVERRRPRVLTREMLDRQQAPLSDEEMQVLQAHRIARRQRDAVRESSTPLVHPVSRWSSLTDNDHGPRSPNSRNESTSTTDRRTSGIASFTSPQGVSIDRVASFRAFIDRQNRERERRDQQRESHAQLSAVIRRNSMSTVLATLETSLEQEASAAAARAIAPGDAVTGFERLNLTPQPDRLSPIATSENPSIGSLSPWAEIEALYRSRLYSNETAAAPPPDRSSRLRVEVEDEDRRETASQQERDFAHRLRQPWRPFEEGEGSSVSAVATGLRQAPRGSVDTTGCCWSDDGTVLYVGAEDGIYEYHVNIAARKLHPSIVLR